MTSENILRHLLWVVAAVALGFTALMAWIAITTFGPPDTLTLLIRIALLGSFVIAAILMEQAIRTAVSGKRRGFLAGIVAIAILELFFVIWMNR